MQNLLNGVTSWGEGTLGAAWPVVWNLAKIVALLLPLLGCVAYLTLWERKMIAYMHLRIGPNRVGPKGLLQPIADAFKLMLKEIIVPSQANKGLYVLGPVMTIMPAMAAWVVIPFGPELALANVNAGLLLLLAITSMEVYGVIIAGWASNSKYAFLGAMRASAQMVSYEIAMGLSLVTVFLYSSSMSSSQIVSSQRDVWHVIPAFFAFFVYVVTMVGETNRLPFDLAEGEGEIVGGFFTEYSGMRFAMFFLGEYINMFTVSALATTLFLGGYHAPPGIAAINDGMFNTGWWGLLWFTLKLWVFMFFFVWLRGSLPRVRYDQFMRFGWKFLIPATLAWIVAVAFWKGAQNGWMGTKAFHFLGRDYSLAVLAVVGITAVALIIVSWILGDRAERRLADREIEIPAEINPFAGGYPVPPLPGQRLVEPTRDDAPALTKEASRG